METQAERLARITREITVRILHDVGQNSHDAQEAVGLLSALGCVLQGMARGSFPRLADEDAQHNEEELIWSVAAMADAAMRAPR